jgi:hypothetical protein
VKRRCRQGARVAALALALSALGAQPAFATFHEMVVREVYAGSVAQPGSQYVELQMWAPGQNFVGGHVIGIYNASGAPVGSATFTSDVSGNANQSTLVAATPAAESEFNITADTGLTPGLLDPAGGAVCWETLDCVAWGKFSGLAKSPVGQPAAPAGIPDGMALRRTIAPGCPTLLESSDDQDNSIADFSAAFPAPRPNSVPPSEHSCASAGGSGPGGGSGSKSQPGSGPPQTQLERKPPKRTRDRTPTFRFDSEEAGVRFECKLDRGPFRPCRSPLTTHRLSLGMHTFRARARDSSGQVDPSPAAYSFRITKPRRPKRP